MNVFDFAKEHSLKIPNIVKTEGEELPQNDFTGPDGSVHKLVEYRGIFLTKEEFMKCCKINKVIESDQQIKAAKDNSIEEYAVKLWEQTLKSQFGFNIKLAKLELKDEVVSAGLKNPITVWACRFQEKRPFLFLLILDNGNVKFVDEKQFDAFDHGPYKKPLIEG